MEASVVQALDACLQRLRAGEAAASEELFTLLRPRVEASVRRQALPAVLRWVQRDDLVQTILQEVMRELEELPPELDGQELLRRVQRTAQCRVRDAARNHRRMIGSSAGPSAVRMPGPDSRTTGPVTAEDRHRRLEEVLGHLPEKYAVVVRLCGLEGLSFVEAGERLGLPADTVRKRLDRVREELAERLQGREWL